MTARKDHIKHALHNEKICNYLGKNESHSDWVIITAFYSALHFTRHLIVSECLGGSGIVSFENIFLQNKRYSDGRHGFQKYYINLHHPDICFEYEKLHEWSVNARYNTHEYDRGTATKAKAYLKRIKEYVTSEKAKVV
ncbi:hypothetical protein Barb4_02399 [Bacteroidales bacterium Barb4]|nr:hypothetical protein Barb4_02399 [Bacteroidales bacterium Barb4]